MEPLYYKHKNDHNIYVIQRSTPIFICFPQLFDIFVLSLAAVGYKVLYIHFALIISTFSSPSDPELRTPVGTSRPDSFDGRYSMHSDRKSPFSLSTSSNEEGGLYILVFCIISFLHFCCSMFCVLSFEFLLFAMRDQAQGLGSDWLLSRWMNS